MDFESANAYLESFISYENSLEDTEYDEKKYDPERVRRFLVEFGVDHSGLRIVHVAGSKGKGSVCGLVAAYLNEIGESVGLFTSPHLVDVRERIQLNGKMVTKKEFCRVVAELKAFIGSGGCNLTYFELLFVVALKIFVENEVEYAVLEVGLGGRLDATNIVRPEVCALTRVEEEHLGILGNNIDEILNEKLGIKKSGVPFLVGVQSFDVETKLRERFVLDKSVGFVEDLVNDIEIGEFFTKADNANVRLVYAILYFLVSDDEHMIDCKAFGRVLFKFWLPGRFDVRSDGEKIIVFDVAHTVSSTVNLIDKLGREFPDKKYVFLISLMKGKNVEGIFDLIRGAADEVYFTSSHKERGYKGKELADLYGGDCMSNEYPSRAFYSCLADLRDDQILVVTGSHFLVGKVFEKLGIL